MKYLFIDSSAIEDLTLNKQYQAYGFEKSKQLLKFIKCEEDKYFDGDVEGFYDIKSQGKIMISKNGNLSKGVIIDFDTFPKFSELTDSQIITVFQKILKFAKRHSSGNVFSSNEKILSADRAKVYPFPFSTGDSYKVMIDRNPQIKRFEKREVKYIQIYAAGTGTITVEPIYNNLKKFFENRSEIIELKRPLNANINQVNKESALHVSNIEGNSYSIDGVLSYDNWMQILTTNQKEFVERQICGPERLEGGAGTGKTLSLVLKIINRIKRSEESNTPFRIIFITHTTSTKNQIIDQFESIYPPVRKYLNGEDSYQYLEINTLNEWCVNNLGKTIDENQLLERDAQDSKTHQYLLIEEIFQNVKVKEYKTYKDLISSDLMNFIENTPNEFIVEMIQFEIGVTIKGRAEEDFDKYLKLLDCRSPYNIPARQRSDLDFLFLIYDEYKKRLSNTDQYDVDDIVLSSLGILKTPIWRRRRSIDGYDIVVVDEAHLFNFNELSVFHNLLKIESSNNIVVAIDKAQAVGDRGLTDDALLEQLNIKNETKSKYETIFRSSPDIVNLAYSVLSSGANLFIGRFDNPFDNNTEFSFTEEEELKSKNPSSYGVENYEKLISTSFCLAEEYATTLQCSKDEILIVACSDLILDDLSKFASTNNKPHEVLKRRGDFDVLKSAKKTNRFIIGGIDFVGGLEFQGVIIVGTDKGRVPPTESERTFSFHFVNYAWHNRLYVAITRAKYAVTLLYERPRTLSPILSSAVTLGFLEDNNNCKLQK